mmetsp:Transcript_12370/g.55818  ORF Transcript_12370/g.55818 Transcript_12370/m.55818 type:complete len:202 (+) Transcript_12370:1865-2470(+)
MALSVRPTNVLAISAHLLPNWWCAMMSLRSSSRDHSSRLISGLRWLYHRSRHCFPMRPGSCCAILDHCFAPSWPTSSMILSSSSLVHGPLTSSGLRTFCQRWRHWTSVRSSKYSAIFFQFLPLYCATARRRMSSSSGVQPPLADLRVGPPMRPCTGGSSAAFSVILDMATETRDATPTRGEESARVGRNGLKIRPRARIRE